MDTEDMTPQRAIELQHIEDMLATRMRDVKPKRYEHSLGVAETARRLALAYGVDPFAAAAAGLLHDWDKVLDDGELLARAAQYRIPVSGSPTAAVGLLHGPVAAVELPRIFPELPSDVWQAVARHTIGAADMTPLDMVVFIADAIEPHRHGAYADELRSKVGSIGLEELFFRCFAQGLVYVISGGRYLYPTAVDIYNSYARRRCR